MSQRHKDALAAQGGACNMKPLAVALVNAIDEVRAEGGMDIDDPAVRLIVHQLYHLVHGYAIDNRLNVYGDLEAECERKANE
jgi:hypothetical protein